LNPFKVWIPTRQDWNTPNKITNPNMDLCLTDGSGINDRFGASIYGPKYNYRQSILMGSISTAFSAEMMAILRRAELFLVKNMTRRIHICSDSRGPSAAQGKLSEFSKITLV
jgi:hypothetical protein